MRRPQPSRQHAGRGQRLSISAPITLPMFFHRLPWPPQDVQVKMTCVQPLGSLSRLPSRGVHGSPQICPKAARVRGQNPEHPGGEEGVLQCIPRTGNSILSSSSSDDMLYALPTDHGGTVATTRAHTHTHPPFPADARAGLVRSSLSSSSAAVFRSPHEPYASIHNMNHVHSR